MHDLLGRLSIVDERIALWLFRESMQYLPSSSSTTQTTSVMERIRDISSSSSDGKATKVLNNNKIRTRDVRDAIRTWIHIVQCACDKLSNRADAGEKGWPERVSDLKTRLLMLLATRAAHDEIVEKDSTTNANSDNYAAAAAQGGAEQNSNIVQIPQGKEEERNYHLYRASSTDYHAFSDQPRSSSSRARARGLLKLSDSDSTARHQLAHDLGVTSSTLVFETEADAAEVVSSSADARLSDVGKVVITSLDIDLQILASIDGKDDESNKSNKINKSLSGHTYKYWDWKRHLIKTVESTSTDSDTDWRLLPLLSPLLAARVYARRALLGPLELLLGPGGAAIGAKQIRAIALRWGDHSNSNSDDRDDRHDIDDRHDDSGINNNTSKHIDIRNRNRNDSFNGHLQRALSTCRDHMEKVCTALGSDVRCVMSVADCFPPVWCPKRYASYVNM